MRYLILILALFGELTASEEHEIVWGQYKPPEVAVEEVASALQSEATFELKPLGGGYSGGHIYTFDCNGKQYIARRTGGIYGPKGIVQEIAILQEANRAGICPDMLYANSETGLIIMERIDNLLPAEFCPGLIAASDELMGQLIEHLRRMKSLKPIQDIVTDRSDRFELQKAMGTINVQSLSIAIQDTLKECLSWPIETEKVLNHNDLHMRNLLYDGKKLFIIDWERAGWGPRDHDAATICNNQMMTREAGVVFYERFLQRKPTTDEVVRFNRLRVMNAATNGMFGYSRYKPGAKNPLAYLQRESCIETVRNFSLALDRGKIDLTDDAALQAFGLAWLHYAAYLNNSVQEHAPCS